MGLIGKKIFKKAEEMKKSIYEMKAEFVYLILWETSELTGVVRGHITAPSQFKLANIFRNWISQRKFLLFC